MSSTPRSPREMAVDSLQVPFPDVARFVRQLSHDLRNHLNAAELQSAYLGELSQDAELKDEVKRLRAMLSEMSASLHKVTEALSAITLTLMPYEAPAFLEDLRAKLMTLYPTESESVEWVPLQGTDRLEIDPQILQPALLELFANAFQHERADGPIRVAAELGGSEFVFKLVEPKPAFAGNTERWGMQPFGKMQHGHYGLGLPRVRSIIEAHHGQLRAHYDADSSSLITTVVLPIKHDG